LCKETSAETFYGILSMKITFVMTSIPLTENEIKNLYTVDISIMKLRRKTLFFYTQYYFVPETQNGAFTGYKH
jgi:hypothetical protein